MCMNCGCGRPYDDMGKPDNITANDLMRAAEANGQSLRESAQHIVETVALMDSSRRDDRGLAEPAARSGGAAGSSATRGTPSTES